MHNKNNMANLPVYLDYNATTPLDPEVKQSITGALEIWGNPSSGHVFGFEAKKSIQLARCQVAKLLNVVPTDVVFTSGGTEANNQVIHTAVNAAPKRICHNQPDHLPHIVTTTIEHDSIRAPLETFEHLEKCSVTYVSVSAKTGMVSPEEVVSACNANTVLVTVMLANNETGVIQPIKEIAKALTKYNEKTHQRILFHTDAAQAIGKINVDVTDLGVDYLTLVGHKFYGPRIGALVAAGLGNGKIPLLPLLHGGGQESNFRSGTENTAMIAGLGKAAEVAMKSLPAGSQKMRQLRHAFETKLLNVFGKAVSIHFRHGNRLPNTSSVAFKQFRQSSSSVLLKCQNFVASAGAACHADNALIGSKVLEACGLSADIASKTIRFSLGRATTEQELETAIEELKNFV